MIRKLLVYDSYTLFWQKLRFEIFGRVRGGAPRLIFSDLKKGQIWDFSDLHSDAFGRPPSAWGCAPFSLGVRGGAQPLSLGVQGGAHHPAWGEQGVLHPLSWGVQGGAHPSAWGCKGVQGERTTQPWVQVSVHPQPGPAPPSKSSLGDVAWFTMTSFQVHLWSSVRWMLLEY